MKSAGNGVRIVPTRQSTSSMSTSSALLSAAIALNDGGLKGNPLELGYLEGDIPGSGGEAAAVVAAAVALALFIALIPGRLGQLLRLGLQQLVEGFLYAASHKFLELTRLLPRLAVQSSRTWFAVSFQNGVSRLHSIKVL